MDVQEQVIDLNLGQIPIRPLRLLIISCATGFWLEKRQADLNNHLSDMTEQMWESLWPSLAFAEKELLDRPVRRALHWEAFCTLQGFRGRGPNLPNVTSLRRSCNGGFAHGMELALTAALRRPADWILCLNNDLEFPEVDWLARLLEAADAGEERIYAPTVSCSYTSEHEASGPNATLVPFNTAMCPAIAWLVPMSYIQYLRRSHGFWLFKPGLGLAWGEDNYTAHLLAGLRPQPFCIVPASWIHHLGQQSSNQVSEDKKAIAYRRYMSLM